MLAHLLPASGYLHGGEPSSIDAAIYGFIANIHFYDIDTPLKRCVHAHANLVVIARRSHARVASPRDWQLTSFDWLDGTAQHEAFRTWNAAVEASIMGYSPRQLERR